LSQFIVKAILQLGAGEGKEVPAQRLDIKNYNILHPMILREMDVKR